MSRVINTNSPGKNRNRLMRTCAELLRHLSQKQAVDEESKDICAYLVLCLREIDKGIDDSASVWEKRDYWMKAEKLRQRWTWVGSSAANIAHMVENDAWHELPDHMMKLFPNFADIKVTKLTRDASLWYGAYDHYMKDAR